ncbi:MAG: pyridoxamine 5'-phosphate oxidase [Gemmatimonadetes bacterium]|nr:pyridoxamine 5'-phosphate oxidase [Gemmatimonadota bacterium]NIO33304.1 pyridoxamine 5'-phosphate oxidase [Gemmatimonadota bacterium]
MLGRGVLKGLSEEAAGPDPLTLFTEWFEDAKRSGIYLPDAMTLATASKDGRPSARLMLLKGFDERGFRFFTNYESRKADDLTDNPRAALVFHWSRLQRQVRVEGKVEKLPEQESQEYFATRPRGSQLGAWASNQSSPIDDRRQLEESFREHEARFKGADVPLPPFWGGYRVIPDAIEFWQGRANRLHDRLRYTLGDDGWTVARLSP